MLIFLILCLLALPVLLHAQVDSTFRFYFYDQRYSLFTLLPDTPNEIIMLGNSITNGGNWEELLNNPNVKNRGISGDNTFGILHRLGEVTASQPDKIFLLIGINDLSRDTPVEVILRNYRRIIRQVMTDSPRTRLYLQSVLPTNNEFDHFPRAQNKDHKIRDLNKGIENLAAEFGQTFIDLYPHFLDEKGRLSSQYTNDGLHLMGEGYILWAEIIRPYIEESIVDEPGQDSPGDLYYQRRRAMQEAMPVVEGAVVMFGNSITEQGPWAELMPGITILNRGIGGDNLAGMKDRLPGVLRHQPSAILIMAGINNILFREATPKKVAHGITELVEIIKKQSPDTRIIIQSILPVNEILGGERDFFRNKHDVIEQANKLLKELSEQKGLVFLDLYPAFTDDTGRLNAEYTIDGIHLNAPGYNLWTDILKDRIFASSNQ